jgi:hypothetical protein
MGKTRAQPRRIFRRDAGLARHGVQGKITKPRVTAGMVEDRARELALIAGRSVREITTSDRREARRELLGAIHPTSRRKDRRTTDTAQWDAAPVSVGRRISRRLPSDDQTTKELVEEGVDEAEHDEMLCARKTRSGFADKI